MNKNPNHTVKAVFFDLVGTLRHSVPEGGAVFTDYVRTLVDVFREVSRVLRDDGTLWLNLGDSYQGSKGQSGGVDPKQPARRHAPSAAVRECAGAIRGRVSQHA